MYPIKNALSIKLFSPKCVNNKSIKIYNTPFVVFLFVNTDIYSKAACCVNIFPAS